MAACFGHDIWALHAQASQGLEDFFHKQLRYSTFSYILSNSILYEHCMNFSQALMVAVSVCGTFGSRPHGTKRKRWGTAM